MSRPITTVSDLYTNPQLQGAPSPIAVTPGATHMHIDTLPVLTVNDQILPYNDQALPIPNGVFYNDNPVVLPQGPTASGGLILGPNRKPSVFL
ncbi:MAG: hypothetical protein AAFQ98_21360 [Bacteroidota bacterium]